MKFLLIALFLLLNTVAATAQKKSATKTPPKIVKVDKYHDNIDNRMKGPNGEVIYIGANGGRYYMKNHKKVYVEYKGNKKKK